MHTPRYVEVPPGDIFQQRRERVFMLLSGIFIGSMTLLNVLGITRFLDLSFTVFGVTVPMPLAVGVLPYPITFLCTDFISELYGKRRASFLVWVGLLVNVWLVVILWAGGALPGFDEPVPGPDGRLPVFFELRTLALGAVAASMIAYLVAQLVDVHVFHALKRWTGGRHLWLRNNGSTLVSQLVDSIAVITITHYYAGALPIEADQPIVPQLATFIATAYVFKLLSALVDTVPFYFGRGWLAAYLGLERDANDRPMSIEESAAVRSAAVALEAEGMDDR
ncbi:MAG: queuosine precursor transporter [Acidobacteriota bacterium]